MDIKPVDKTMNLKDYVYHTIRDAIMKADYPPGKMLSEQELSTVLGASRTPVREAFIQLSKEGLVRIYPQRGTVVTHIDREEVKQSQFIRESLEVAVLRKLTSIVTSKEIQKLQAIIDEQRIVCEKEDYIKFYELDELFHQTMADMSGHSKVWEVIKDIKIQMDRVRMLSLPKHSHLIQLINQHQGIIDAMGEKDMVRVEEIIRKHLNEVFDTQRSASEYGDFFK